MRQSIAPGRQSTMGPQRSTGLSNHFPSANNPRYSIAVPGTGQRPSMAAPRRNDKEAGDEQARDLAQFLHDNGAIFPCEFAQLRNSPLRNEFRILFEFMIKMISQTYELNDSNQIMNEVVPAIMDCLNYPHPIKRSAMVGLNSSHQWSSFLSMFDWLRKVILKHRESEPVVNSKHEYFLKYTVDCYKHKANTQDGNFGEILSAIQEVINCDSGYDNISNKTEQAKQSISDSEASIEAENIEIAQIEKEISEHSHEIKQLNDEESDLKRRIDLLFARQAESDNEYMALEEKLKSLRAENVSLNEQVAAQPISAYQAQELLQRRNILREEEKEKKSRHEKLCAVQSDVSKNLAKLSTDKTRAYRGFCSDLAQLAVTFNAETEYRRFEASLFGNSSSADSLRAAHLNSRASDDFRNLIGAIRKEIQKQLTEMTSLRLESKLQQLQNQNRMHKQKLQQIEQRNKVDIDSRSIKLREAKAQLTQAQEDYGEIDKQNEKLKEACDVEHVRIEAQTDQMRQIEVQMAEIEAGENNLMTEFADFMAKSIIKFNSLSKLNKDLMAQREFLVDAGNHAGDHIQQMYKDMENKVKGIKVKKNKTNNV